MPIDRKTAARLAKIAVQAISDDETRSKIIFISLAPIISVLLILAFIVYILTNPIEMFVLVYTDHQMDLCDIIPNIKNYVAIDGKAIAYICEGFTCQQPITVLSKLTDSFFS